MSSSLWKMLSRSNPTIRRLHGSPFSFSTGTVSPSVLPSFHCAVVASVITGMAPSSAGFSRSCQGLSSCRFGLGERNPSVAICSAAMPSRRGRRG